MRKRQRKKNEKKALCEFLEYLKSLNEIIQHSNASLTWFCELFGHKYKRIDEGVLCLCCGDLIDNESLKKMAEVGQKAGSAGEQLKDVVLHFKIDLGDEVKGFYQKSENF